MNISRRSVLASSAAIVSMLPGAIPLGRAAARKTRRQPNIVFIVADDLGYGDLSCYGRREYQTKALDALAASGVRFTQGYANTPVCSATRTALMTGRYQSRLPVGLEEPVGQRPGIGLPPSHPTLPSLLREVGYQTALVGKWHLGRLPEFGPLKSGYDHFWGMREGSVDYFTHEAFGNRYDLWDGDTPANQKGYLTDLLGQKSIDMVRQMSASDKPFFMSLHFNAPHWPWEAPGDEAEATRLSKNPLGILHYDGGSMKTYGEIVVAMDRQIGRLMNALEQLRIADDTIIIFTSDNGGERFSNTWPFKGMKTELLEGGIRAPFIVRWPGLSKPRSISEQVILTMDFVPTLLAAAGGKMHPDYPADGIDIREAIAGAPARSRTVHFRYKHMSQEATRDGDWKYLKIRDNTFLFNVVEDPQERANLKLRRPDIFARLVAAHGAWEATMLPIDPKSFTHGYDGSELADHFSED
ncbi:twin-arginine translocation pathway signal protein [Sphingobium sp. SCG-1]|uniref:sulfatase family protein n=1 Tax=Sphingobium sp. SCG-1 TaxID=2072936 RepID=UPI000CD6812F|nr:sulfatase-like hydrolase/transferase [Sphingobium sp. SCG-1]AUW59301.1 twin-arginine translocation pathway signal protein [Sphingobium sp. SCG-1]